MNKKGFTLIELLVVVLIIGILSSVALPQYTKAVEKSRMSEAWAIIKAINDAQSIRNMEMGTTGVNYSFDDLTIGFTDKNGNAPTSCTLESKNFTYYCPGVATKYYDGEYVTLSIVNGKRKCFASGTVCKKLGFSSTSSSCMTGGGALINSSCFSE